MKSLERIDKNFIVDRESKNGMVEYAIPCPYFDLYGVFYDESRGKFLRMPLDAAERVSEAIYWGASNTAGGRLRFRTNARRIELTVEIPGLCKMSHMTLLASGGFTLLKETPKGEELCRSLMPGYATERTYRCSADLSGEWEEYILYFPLYSGVNGVKIALNEDAGIERPKKYKPHKPIVYYGSSITQGGCSNRPDTCYNALICKWNGMDFVNLGFSGSARGEREMAEYLAGLECSLFVCDYDYNAPDVRHLRDTHFRLYEIFRNTQPQTPIIFITKPDARRDEEARARKAVIYETYKKAKRRGDGNVYFIDGKSFYNEAESDICTVDGCHPTDVGFLKMAKKLYAKMCKIDKIFQ